MMITGEKIQTTAGVVTMMGVRVYGPAAVLATAYGDHHESGRMIEFASRKLAREWFRGLVQS